MKIPGTREFQTLIKNKYTHKITESEILEAENNLTGFFETLIEIVQENNIKVENEHSKKPKYIKSG